MPTVRIEHQIHTFDAWKAAFDRDPAGRRETGVRSYRILRPIDDPAYVMIDLDFDTTAEAEAFLTVMHNIWQSPQAAPALQGSPQTRIVEVVEDVTLLPSDRSSPLLCSQERRHIRYDSPATSSSRGRL